jgi:hypothetical protein
MQTSLSTYMGAIYMSSAYKPQHPTTSAAKYAASLDQSQVQCLSSMLRRTSLPTNTLTLRESPNPFKASFEKRTICNAKIAGEPQMQELGL